MSINSGLVLPQSTTALTKRNTNNDHHTFSKESNTRLQLYNNLFSQGRNKICDKTGLQFKTSLNYSLYTFLHLCDINWVLAIIDIAQIDEFADKYGRENGKRKVIQIATVIKNFCENDPRKLKGFKYNNDGDIFALLMYCHPKLIKAEKYISKLIEKIKQQTNEDVYVGIAKMNNWETYEEWKQRAMSNLNNVKNISETETETNTENSLFFSDIGIQYMNGHEKQQQDEQKQLGVVKKSGTTEEFDLKMKEISNNEDYEWIGAIMSIDDFDEFLYDNQENKDLIRKEMDKLEYEMYHLFDIYGNEINKNEIKYFGYHLKSRNTNGEFGLILYDSKDRNKCYIPAHEILETLKEEISMKCQFTVSIGSSRLIEDDLGMMDDWYERMRNNLKQAQKTGKNQICFGNVNSGNDDIVESKFDKINGDSNVVDREAEKIQSKTLQEIKKYGFSAAVDLSKVEFTVNNGNLMTEYDIDVKWDADDDPTTSSQLILNFANDITFKQLFLEVTKFMQENGQYLQYPKLFLTSNKPKCKDNRKCKQCTDNNVEKNNNNNNGSVFCLCSTKRREIANELLDSGKQQRSLTDSLSTTARELFSSDKLLIKDSNDYVLKPNWFVNLYCFLQWQKAIVQALLQNLVEWDVVSAAVKAQGKDEDSDTEFRDDEKAQVYVTDNVDDSSTNEVEERVFLFKFDLLTTLHSYLDQLIEYLVLYYTCFDSQSWIGVFYPFIEAAIGTLQCAALFAESNRQNTSHVKSLCAIIFATMQENISVKEPIDTAEKCIQETKAVSIFSRILCDVYADDDCMAINTNVIQNPFDLSDKIYCKMQEIINNIKTQLKLHEMTGKNVYGSNDNNNKQTSIVKEKIIEKDDWATVEDENGLPIIMANEFKSTIPSFIQLFVIRRIITNYLRKKNCTTTKQITVEIKKLSNKFKETQSSVNNILRRLINDGIKDYMKKYYDEKNINIIEMIFSELILTKFEKEYHELTMYVGNDKIQMKIFNSSDLMCAIFEYLEHGKYLAGDLFHCSLVDTHWLYHVWNVNSVYLIDLRIIEKQRSVWRRRMIPRFINAKYIRYCMYFMEQPDWSMLKPLMTFVHVKKVDVRLYGFDANITLKALMWKCAENIEWCRIRMNVGYGQHKLSPLMLPNARYISICDLYFYLCWSDKCHQLMITHKNVNEKWYQYIIDHCNCSNISLLQVNFTERHSGNKVDKKILTQFASKFVGLQKLRLVLGHNFDTNALVIWQLLKPTIDKNNGSVEIFFHENNKFHKQEAKSLTQTIEEHHLKVDMITVERYDWSMIENKIDGWKIMYQCDGLNDAYQATRVSNQITTYGKANFIGPDTDDVKLMENVIALFTKGNNDLEVSSLSVMSPLRNDMNMNMTTMYNNDNSNNNYNDMYNGNMTGMNGNDLFSRRANDNNNGFDTYDMHTVQSGKTGKSHNKNRRYKHNHGDYRDLKKQKEIVKYVAIGAAVFVIVVGVVVVGRKWFSKQSERYPGTRIRRAPRRYH